MDDSGAAGGGGRAGARPYVVGDGLYCGEVARFSEFRPALAEYRRRRPPAPGEWRAVGLWNEDLLDDGDDGLTREEREEREERDSDPAAAEAALAEAGASDLLDASVRSCARWA